MFQINDKVVCVDDSGWDYSKRPTPPKKGPLYVVNGVVPYDGTGCYEQHGEPTHCVMLVGVEADWHPARFRKLSDIKAEHAAKKAEVRSA